MKMDENADDIEKCTSRRRLCLPVDAEPEVDRLMGDTATAGRDVVTMWWNS